MGECVVCGRDTWRYRRICSLECLRERQKQRLKKLEKTDIFKGLKIGHKTRRK